MQKTVLITGSTDGIGLVTAKILTSMGCNVILHGRNPEKLKKVQAEIAKETNGIELKGYIADLSLMSQVEELAKAIKNDYSQLDGIINNAGVYNVPEILTSEGLDTRFAVNTFAPYLLTKRLLSIVAKDGRVVNLSSAAQAPVDPRAFVGQVTLPHGEAYAESKLALTMFSNQMAADLGKEGPVVVSVNPKSFLGSKLVKEAYGVAGSDLKVGANILVKAVLSEEFADASGKYFDNDIVSFANPHPDALNKSKVEGLVEIIENILGQVENNNKK